MLLFIMEVKALLANCHGEGEYVCHALSCSSRLHVLDSASL